VVGVADAVDGRVAHIHVRRGHRVFADLGAQDVLAVGVFAGLHVAEQLQRFFARTVAERRVGARRAEVAAVGRHVFGRLAVDVGIALLDQVFGHLVQLVEVVRRVVQVVFDRAVRLGIVVVKAQPFHAVDDGVDVFLLFLGRVGVVETQVAAALIIARQPEVQADRLGVADVQVAVRFGREAGDDAGHAFADVGAGREIGFDDGAQEIGW
jgi:hypothetical protein